MATGATAWSVRIALDPKRVAGRIGRGQSAAVVEINELVCTVRPEVDHTAGAIGAVVDVDAGDVVARVDDGDGSWRRKRSGRTSHIGTSGRRYEQAGEDQC